MRIENWEQIEAGDDKFSQIIGGYHGGETVGEAVCGGFRAVSVDGDGLT